MTHDWEVIILGAGIAGLAAARTLAEAGRRVLVLEAQEEVGGRMRTLHVPGLAAPVELGAEFIHGRPPELLALLEEAGLATVEAGGDLLCYRDGRVSECPEDSSAWELLDGMEAVAAEHGDMSFDQYLARSGASAAAKQRIRDYVEGFNAADAGEIGIAGLARQQAAEDAIEGDRGARVVGGYRALAAYVAGRARAAGAQIELLAPVHRVEWQPGSCIAQVGGGRQPTAKQLICALPLGVLQADAVRFAPRPESAWNALRLLRAGAVQRLVLQFESRWWAADYPDLRFLFAPTLHPPTYWTAAPQQNPLLTCWTGGPRARQSLTTEAVEEQAVRALARVFGREAAPRLAASYMHDWQADPYARGAYSYAATGGAAAPDLLARPVQGTLFFAGEHTDTTGHLGTVHGALRSGLRAAREVLTSA